MHNWDLVRDKIQISILYDLLEKIDELICRVERKFLSVIKQEKTISLPFYLLFSPVRTYRSPELSFHLLVLIEKRNFWVFQKRFIFVYLHLRYNVLYLNQRKQFIGSLYKCMKKSLINCCFKSLLTDYVWFSTYCCSSQWGFSVRNILFSAKNEISNASEIFSFLSP